MNDTSSNTSLSAIAKEYSLQVADTDILSPTAMNPVLFGLFGEVGGIMSATKKYVREGNAYPGYKRAALQEFGDTLWYLAAVCRRNGIAIETAVAEAQDRPPCQTAQRPATIVGTEIAVSSDLQSDRIDRCLLQLGNAATAILDAPRSHEAIVRFTKTYLRALEAAGIGFAEVAESNAIKARGAFLSPKESQLNDFDRAFPADERLPSNFRIRISQRSSGKSYLQWNGVFIGDPLTDNIEDSDGYRFHDVFHFANAAILHWSPVVRALIKHKRKSSSMADETQDGGRAIVVEEGLTAWLFTRAKELNYFDGQTRVSLDILKIIQEFVTGFEVSTCSLKLWERSILEGYAVFRKVRDANGGWLVGDRKARTIKYEPIEASK